MTLKQIWEEFVRTNRENLIGGEIEVNDPHEGIFRAPISEVAIEGGALVITAGWTAHQEGDLWHVTENLPFAYPIVNNFLSEPVETEDGRCCFTYPLDVITLTPRGEDTLAPEDVVGL